MLIGLDTSLLVRLLTNDDVKQVNLVIQLMEHNTVFIPKSVLLETEWVLRYTYQLTKKTISEAFEKLLGLPQVVVEDLPSILQTLKWYHKGFDFADALHLASSYQTEKFATFDKIFIKKAKQAGIELFKL